MQQPRLKLAGFPLVESTSRLVLVVYELTRVYALLMLVGLSGLLGLNSLGLLFLAALLTIPLFVGHLIVMFGQYECRWRRLSFAGAVACLVTAPPLFILVQKIGAALPFGP